jgi:hypothetical protein
MFLLFPGTQSAALLCVIAAMANFFVWPSIFPNFLGLTWQQWGMMFLIMAF